MDRHGGRQRAGTGAAPDRTRLITIPARAESVADARRMVVELLDAHGAPSTIIEDLQLVTSELVTNGVMHGRGETVHVELHIDDGPPAVAVLAVSNVGPVNGIPEVDDWRPAPPTAITGRGLGIVRRLSDEVSVREEADRATIVVRRRLLDSGVSGRPTSPPDSSP